MIDRLVRHTVSWRSMPTAPSSRIATSAVSSRMKRRERSERALKDWLTTPMCAETRAATPGLVAASSKA